MKAYKVLRRHKGKLYSAVKTPLATRYFKTKRTVPKLKGSKFFVFENYSAAVNFLQSSRQRREHCEIWEVDVPKLIKDIGIIAPFKGPVEFLQLSKMLWRSHKKLSWTQIDKSPTGTFNATSVKLVKQAHTPLLAL